jgi:hypothetical protein
MARSNPCRPMRPPAPAEARVALVDTPDGGPPGCATIAASQRSSRRGPRRETMRVFGFDLLPYPERLDHLKVAGELPCPVWRRVPTLTLSFSGGDGGQRQ